MATIEEILSGLNQGIQNFQRQRSLAENKIKADQLFQAELDNVQRDAAFDQVRLENAQLQQTMINQQIGFEKASRASIGLIAGRDLTPQMRRGIEEITGPLPEDPAQAEALIESFFGGRESPTELQFRLDIEERKREQTLRDFALIEGATARALPPEIPVAPPGPPAIAPAPVEQFGAAPTPPGVAETAAEFARGLAGRDVPVVTRGLQDDLTDLQANGIEARNRFAEVNRARVSQGLQGVDPRSDPALFKFQQDEQALIREIGQETQFRQEFIDNENLIRLDESADEADVFKTRLNKATGEIERFGFTESARNIASNNLTTFVAGLPPETQEKLLTGEIQFLPNQQRDIDRFNLDPRATIEAVAPFTPTPGVLTGPDIIEAGKTLQGGGNVTISVRGNEQFIDDRREAGDTVEITTVGGVETAEIISRKAKQVAKIEETVLAGLVVDQVLIQAPAIQAALDIEGNLFEGEVKAGEAPIVSFVGKSAFTTNIRSVVEEIVNQSFVASSDDPARRTFPQPANVAREIMKLISPEDPRELPFSLVDTPIFGRTRQGGIAIREQAASELELHILRLAEDVIEAK